MFPALRKKRINSSAPLARYAVWIKSNYLFISSSSKNLKNVTVSKYSNTKRCIRTANKQYSGIKDYGKGSPGENGHNVKHINSFYY